MQVFLDEIDITADEDLLSQVWINLIHNSIKFTPEGGKVRLDLHRHGDQMEVKISDIYNDYYICVCFLKCGN